MDNYVVAVLSFVGLVIFATGFFIGRAERSSARVSRIYDTTENRVGTPL